MIANVGCEGTMQPGMSEVCWSNPLTHDGAVTRVFLRAGPVQLVRRVVCILSLVLALLPAL
eukprot:1159321-Pelagomonas_calceolata.AAC.4